MTLLKNFATLPSEGSNTSFSQKIRVQVSSGQTVVLCTDINALDRLKISVYFKIDYLMRLRRSPFRVPTSYAEHFHLVSVHVQKLDFHDDCPTHHSMTNPQNSDGEAAPRYGG